jgi:hypothetical protein
LDIAWFRDLIIIIYGIISIGVFIALIVFMIGLWRRARGIMDLLNITAKHIEEISYSARKEIITPMAQVGAIIRGLAKGIEVVSGIFRRK